MGRNTTSQHGSRTIQRMVLKKFGFDTDDDNVKKYKFIFRKYYKSSTDYDEDIMNAVHYLRENRLLYYTAKRIKINDTLPDVTVCELDGKTKTSIYKIIEQKKYDKTIVAAFSLS